jgi:hypothetical protein
VYPEEFAARCSRYREVHEDRLAGPPGLIIDPPDGRVPRLYPAADQRRARNARAPADSYADLPIWSRCITRGWNGIGGNYSSHSQIVGYSPW